MYRRSPQLRPQRFALIALAAFTGALPATCASITLLTPPGGYVASEGTAINNSGQISVTLYTTTFGTNPFSSALYTEGAFTSVQGTANKQVADGINNAGTIVGSFFPGVQTSSAFSITQGGTPTNLKNLNTANQSGGSQALAINDNGLVVGEAYTANNAAEQAVAWIAGTVSNPSAPTASTTPVDLGTFGSQSTGSVAFSINSPANTANYEIVGTAGISTTTGDGYAFLYTKAGGLKHVPGLTNTFSDAYAVNNSGQITGDEETAGGDFEAFLYDPSGAGSITLLGTLNESNSEGNAVNSGGQIVGDAYDLDDDGDRINETAFLYSNGAMIDLDDLLPANSGWILQYAEGINDSGQVVGYGLFNNVEEGFLLNTQDAPSTPEPGTLLLLAGGMAAVLTARKRSPLSRP